METREFEPEKPEENAYTSDDLDRDTRDWVQDMCAKLSSDSAKEWLKSLSGLQLFCRYMNNFRLTLERVSGWISPDGKWKPKEMRWAEEFAMNYGRSFLPPEIRPLSVILNPEQQKAARALGDKFFSDIIKVMSDAGLTEESVKKNGELTDEQLEKIKNAFIKMRNLGYERLQLIG